MTLLTRRLILAAIAAAVGQPLSAYPGALPATAGLRDHAKRAGMMYGAAISADNLADPTCRAIYETEARIVTTDLALKFWTLRPARDVFNFGPADDIVHWCRANDLFMRGHTLIWNEYNGDWINRCSAREVERIFDEHIERVVSRYVGRIHTWDVVNEPFWPDHGEPGGFRRGPWYNALGPSYITRALKRVRSIDPDAKLCINEAHCENENSWGNAIRPCLARFIGELREADTPLDAVGLQCHLQPTIPHDDGRLAAYFQSLATHQVDLHITEFDCNDASFPDDIGTRDQMVASRVSAFLNTVLAVPQIKMLITWELTDKRSLYENEALKSNPQATRLPRTLPFDDDLQRKPMWTAIARAFDRRAGV